MPTIAGSCLTLDFCLCPHSRRSRLPIIPVVSQIKAKCCGYLYWNPFYMHQCRNWNLKHFCHLGSLPVTIFTYVISGCATLKYAFGAIYRNSNYRKRLCWNESKCGQHSWLMGPNPALEFFQVLWLPPLMGCVWAGFACHHHRPTSSCRLLGVFFHTIFVLSVGFSWGGLGEAKQTQVSSLISRVLSVSTTGSGVREKRRCNFCAGEGELEVKSPENVMPSDLFLFAQAAP